MNAIWPSVYDSAAPRCIISLMPVSSVKRTNINLDTDLVAAAASVLGTAQTTETVHAALRDVVQRAARQRLAARDFGDLTPQTLEQLRTSRTRG